MAEHSIEFHLGEINAELRAIGRRLDDGSRRHADLGAEIAELRTRIMKLEMIEAKRGGVLAAMSVFASALGAIIALIAQYLIRKL